MGAPVAPPTASSSDVDHRTTNLVPEVHGAPHTIYSGRLASSWEESNTKSKKPHDAIFTYRRALKTSSWKIWMTTKSFLPIKTNRIRRMRINTRPNEEYRPHPPTRFQTIRQQMAEFPQT